MLQMLGLLLLPLLLLLLLLCFLLLLLSCFLLLLLLLLLLCFPVLLLLHLLRCLLPLLLILLITPKECCLVQLAPHFLDVSLLHACVSKHSFCSTAAGGLGRRCCLSAAPI
jgi:hypothetical protein